MVLKSVDRGKFLTGIKYGLYAEAILLTILVIVWVIFVQTLSTLPIGIFTFFYGGLLFTISGCIGPGRYQKEFDLLLYTPEIGSSHSDTITVSGFVVDESISKANIIVNGQEAGTIRFGDDYTGEVEISRKDFINQTINTIYLEADNVTSNVNDFTLFEYTEDMTQEEIDDLYEMESKPPVKTLHEAQENYLSRINSRVGSIALGIAALGLFNFLLGIFLDQLFGLNF